MQAGNGTAVEETSSVESKRGLYYSGKTLGWSIGENVTEALVSFFANTAKPGDTLVLEHTYELSAPRIENVQLPTGFTLAAEKGGGFAIIETKTSADGNDGPSNLGPLFRLGDHVTINNVVFTHPEAPDTGTNAVTPTRHVDWHNATLFASPNTNHVRFLNVESRGNISHHFTGSSRNLRFRNTLIEGGFWAVMLSGPSISPHFHQSVFRDSLGDGIKTGAGGGGPGTVYPLVTESIFEGNNRDGIDTTGGFVGGIIRDTVFRHNNFTSLDLKNFFERKSQFHQDRLNRDILIEDCYFLDSGNNAIVLTTLDRTEPPTINDSNAADYIVKNITVRNSVFQISKDRPSKKMWLIKDARNIYWDNVELLGNIKEKRVLSRSGYRVLEVCENCSNYNLTGTNVTYGPARTFSQETAYPFPYGQRELELD